MARAHDAFPLDRRHRVAGTVCVSARRAPLAGEVVVNVDSLLKLVLYLGTLTALAVPLGEYMARVYTGRSRVARSLLGPFESFLYRGSGVQPDVPMNWKSYGASFLVFNLLGMVVLYALLRLQVHLPLNPAALGPVAPEIAFNTAVSFATNTNWQAYSGETTL